MAIEYSRWLPLMRVDPAGFQRTNPPEVSEHGSESVKANAKDKSVDTSTDKRRAVLDLVSILRSGWSFIFPPRSVRAALLFPNVFIRRYQLFGRSQSSSAGLNPRARSPKTHRTLHPISVECTKVIRPTRTIRTLITLPLPSEVTPTTTITVNSDFFLISTLSNAGITDDDHEVLMEQIAQFEMPFAATRGRETEDFKSFGRSTMIFPLSDTLISHQRLSCLLPMLNAFSLA